MIRRALWVLLAAVLCALPATAQETTGAVAGTVVDSSKAAIPGATVKLEGGAVNQIQVSDGNGRYHFAAVPPGTYKLTTTLQGFSTGLAENVAVAIGKTTTVDFSLNVGGVAEQVTVSADTPTVDVAQTTIQTNVTAAAIENLPKGTNMASLLKLAPAARQEAAQRRVPDRRRERFRELVHDRRARDGELPHGRAERQQQPAVRVHPGDVDQDLRVQRRVRRRDRRRGQRGDQERHELVPRHGRRRVRGQRHEQQARVRR